MNNLLEEYDNIIGQVLSEFISFLYSIQYRPKDNILKHNTFIECMMIHMRSLSRFFNINSAMNNSRTDDLFYVSFFKAIPVIQLGMNNDMNNYINKYFAHITTSRGHIILREEEIKEQTEKTIYWINWFINEINTRNLKDEYQELMNDPHISTLKQTIINMIYDYSFQNGVCLENNSNAYTTFREYVAIHDPHKLDWPENLLQTLHPAKTITIKENIYKVEIIEDALSYLTPREERIIRELFQSKKTMSEVEDELYIDKERVRQIKNKALGKLKRNVDLYAMIINLTD